LATNELDDPKVRAFLDASGHYVLRPGTGQMSVIVADTPTGSLDALDALRQAMASGRPFITEIVDRLD
jgi:hypothetical protein